MKYQSQVSVVRKAGFVVASALTISALLAGCEGATQIVPDEDPVVIQQVWDITIPDSAEVINYYHGEFDSRGSGDDVYELSIESDDRTEFWRVEDFGSPASSADIALAGEISETSDAPADIASLEGMTCRESMKKDEDFLLACYSPESDTYVLFERIF